MCESYEITDDNIEIDWGLFEVDIFLTESDLGNVYAYIPFKIIRELAERIGDPTEDEQEV